MCTCIKNTLRVTVALGTNSHSVQHTSDNDSLSPPFLLNCLHDHYYHHHCE